MRTTNRTMTASGDRSKHCQSVAHSPNRNQSYGQEIARSGVTGFKGTVRQHTARGPDPARDVILPGSPSHLGKIKIYHVRK